MYDFSKILPESNLSANWILSKISDAQIFFHYHGRFKLGVSCKSSLKKDEHPSVMFFIGNSGKIIYWDFTEDKGLDCFAYVQTLYNCSFGKALQIIAEDFGIISKKGDNSKVSPKLMIAALALDRSVKRNTLIQFTVKPWDKDSLSFWNLYEIEKEELELEEVFSIDRLFLNKQEIISCDTQRFAKIANYKEDNETKVGVKIYSPYDSKMKWLSSIPLTVPFGMDNLSLDSNLIIVTKSFKDMIVLKKIFKSVIATQNESLSSLPDSIIEYLDNNFDRKLIIFDNDETGVANSKKFNEKGFDYFNIPNKERERFGIKDCADYVKIYGLEALKDLLKSKNLL